jgi:hypothetical protein
MLAIIADPNIIRPFKFSNSLNTVRFNVPKLAAQVTLLTSIMSGGNGEFTAKQFSRFSVEAETKGFDGIAHSRRIGGLGLDDDK